MRLFSKLQTNASNTKHKFKTVGIILTGFLFLKEEFDQGKNKENMSGHINNHWGHRLFVRYALVAYA